MKKLLIILILFPVCATAQTYSTKTLSAKMRAVEIIASNATSTNTKLTTDLAAANKKITDLTTTVNSQATKITTLTAENVALKADNVTIKADLKKSTNHVKFVSPEFSIKRVVDTTLVYFTMPTLTIQTEKKRN